MTRYELAGCGPRVAALLWLTLLAAGPAAAHYPWISPQDYAPEPGQELKFSIGWGHAFPGTDSLDATRIASVVLLAPGDVELALEAGSGTVFVTPPLPGDGPWLLAARQAPGYYSRTPRGGQRGSRTENPDAMSCSFSGNSVKALLGTGVVNRALGFPLEIVPLAGLAPTGDALPVRVLLHGRPWRGTVHAVYAGFAGAEGEYPVAVETDAEGTAPVPLERAGRWMIRASASEPYADPAVCDANHYTSTLTLMVP